VHQPLSQIRMSLSASLGTGQIIFLSGIGVTENLVRRLLKFSRVVAKVKEYGASQSKATTNTQYKLLLTIIT